ncbi:MAG TPA: hypothetical protein IAC41_03360 [Candidatus Merdenecus merdavium]|nr:hypothetical protein [Candidatus Merdenecus merdavium]
MFKRIYGIAKADFLERRRRFSFIIMIAVAVISIFFFVPNPEASVSSITINPNEFAQMSDISWILFATSICVGVFFPIVGGTYIKNGVETDRKYGLSDLAQTSGIKKSEYIFGKILANFFILLVLLIVLFLGSLFMSVIKFPGERIPVKMLWVVVIGSLPNLIFCATVATGLEIIPIFKGNIGRNVGTILLFSIMIANIVSAVMKPISWIGEIFDITNLAWSIQNIEDIVFPISGKHADVAVLSGGIANHSDSSLPALILDDIGFSKEFVVGKVFILFLCCIVAMILSSWAFDEKRVYKSKKAKELNPDRKALKIRNSVSRELGMRCRNISLSWKVVLTLLWALIFLCQSKTGYSIVFPLLCIGCTPLFADIGCREYQCGMNTVLSITNTRFVKQLVGEWVSAFIIFLVMVSPLLFGFIKENEWDKGIGYIGLSILIPSLAAILGEYTEGSRAFELIFIVICYTMLNIPSLIISITMVKCSVLIFVSVIMLLVACVKRSKLYGIMEKISAS